MSLNADGHSARHAPGGLRARAPYVALAVATIAVGLTVHRGPLPLGARARDALGDALWAMMIAWWIGALAPRAALRVRAAAAVALCFAVEASQRYHAPALDALRGTTLGHLVLGNGFDPRDLVAYAVGVLAACLVERAATHSARRAPDARPRPNA